MHGGAEEEVVLAAGEDLLVEEDLEKEPDEEDSSVEPDTLKPEHGDYQ